MLLMLCFYPIKEGALDTTECVYPNDETLDAGVDGADPEEVAQLVQDLQQLVTLCGSLLARSHQASLLRSVIAKTRATLTDPNKAGKLQPFHRTLLQLYVLHSKLAA